MIHPTTITSTNLFNSDVLAMARSEHTQALHPKEAEIQKIFGKSALTLDPADPRPKMLYLLSQADTLDLFPISHSDRSIEEILDLEKIIIENNPTFKDFFISLRNLQTQALKGDEEAILNLKQQELELNSGGDRGIGRFFQKLNEDFDVRFKIVHSIKELCQEIAGISKVDNFKSLIINGQGHPNGIDISTSESLIQSDLFPGKLLSGTGSKLNYMIDDTCFSNIPKDAEITLISHETGESEKSIASTISKLSKRYVYAPQSAFTVQSFEFLYDIPPVPIFTDLFDSRIITTCKFSPDGSRECISSDDPSSTMMILARTMMALATVVAIYRGYKFLESKIV